MQQYNNRSEQPWAFYIQSVRVPNVNISFLDNMLRTITAVQQVMGEFSGAETDEARGVSITKLV
jgi:hypothetical protein